MTLSILFVRLPLPSSLVLLDRRTERSGYPHSLVCAKNTTSYREKLKEYHRDREHLAAVRSIEAAPPR
jgi:hypothetical protein